MAEHSKTSFKKSFKNSFEKKSLISLNVEFEIWLPAVVEIEGNYTFEDNIQLMCFIFSCDYTPSATLNTSTSLNNSVLAGDSSSGLPGYLTFLYGHKKYNRGSGRKRTNNKWTMWSWVNSECKKGGSVTLHSLCICRLTLACISSEISTKLLGMPTHPDWPSLTASFCWPLLTLDCKLILSVFLTALVSSTVHCRLPLCVTLCQLPSLSSFFQLSLSGVPLPTSGHIEISSSGLCLGSHQNKQKDCLLGAPPS